MNFKIYSEFLSHCSTGADQLDPKDDAENQFYEVLGIILYIF